jgi:hypothetical protein
MGIVPERVKRGPPMVFLDSGFMGSLFDKIRDWVGILGHVPNQNYRGYLVKSRGEYREMFFAYPVSEQDATELFNVMTNSPYRSVVYSSAGLNRNICAFMQVSPKFTGKYVQTYQREEDGAWDVLPQKNRLVTKSRIRATTNKICVHYAIEQINSIGTEIGWVNDDVVDPVASLLLQRRALEYFSNPDVHDRVYSSGVKVA